MPLVLAQNEQSAAGMQYADELGTSYEYPAMYKNKIQPGELFIYYQGKRKTGTEIQVPRYFGFGKIGEVSPAPKGRLRCTIEDYQAFDHIVPFKHDGRYLEPGANARPSKLVGAFFQQGVRKIDREAFDEICGLGIPPRMKRAAVSKSAASTKKATGDVHSEMHELAMRLAVAEAKAQWPSAKIFRAPAGEHFSLTVRQSDGPIRHIAVKGTEHKEPRVQLSSGDVAYSDAHATAYSLWVFYALDRKAGTGKLIKRAGRITDDDVDIHAAVHGGRLKNVKAGKAVGPAHVQESDTHESK